MRDLTQGSVRGHILQLSTFIALTTLFQSLYFLVDLYFVGRLGKEAVAGVGLAGNLMMIVLALTQALGVGATSLLAQTMGRRDREYAQVVFNQALVLSVLTGAAYGLVMFAVRGPYSRWLAADAQTAEQSMIFLRWFIPAMSLQFATVTLGAALRAIGDLKIPTLLTVGTVLLNTVLTPVLIFGVGTGRPLGVAGASLASFIAVGAGCTAFVLYFRRKASLFRFSPALWGLQPDLWWRMLRVGLPVGGEFLLMSVYMMLVYDIIRPFGAAAQAGFGIGMRVMQALFLPSVAIGFATAPVAAQNFGARLGPRVRESFYSAAAMSVIVMALLTLLCQVAPAAVVRFFNGDPAVVAFGSEYLRIISWGFVASGVVYVASSVFQGMGHTLPALATSALRLVLFAVPAYVIAHRPGFQTRSLWYIALAAVFIQVAASVWLLHREFDRKLAFDTVAH
jgi:putative MATE family efflux protein